MTTIMSDMVWVELKREILNMKLHNRKKQAILLMLRGQH